MPRKPEPEVLLQEKSYWEFCETVVSELALLRQVCRNKRVGDTNLLSKTSGYLAHLVEMLNEEPSKARLELSKADFIVLAEAMKCFRKFTENPELDGAISDRAWEKFLEAADYLENIIPKEYKSAGRKK